MEKTITGLETTFPAFEDRIRGLAEVTQLFTSRSSIVACNIQLADADEKSASNQIINQSIFERSI